MTSPVVQKLTFGAMAILVAIGVPAAGGYLAHNMTDSVPLAAVAAVALIYQLMALSVAAGALSQYIPDEFALGPSYMAGHGLLTLAMTVGPLLLLPGLVWLFVLPFDAQGHFRPDAVFGLDTSAFEQPHHKRGESA